VRGPEADDFVPGIADGLRSLIPFRYTLIRHGRFARQRVPATQTLRSVSYTLPRLCLIVEGA